MFPQLESVNVGPPVLNSDGDSWRFLWEEMCAWMFDVGVRSFPWQLTWKQQRVHLTIVWRCREKFSDAWNKRMVGTQVSDNFTELHKSHVYLRSPHDQHRELGQSMVK